MIDFSRHSVFPFVIISSIVFTGCQLTNQLKTPLSWTKESNIYTTTLRYDSPGGAEVNKISLVINNDIISGVNFELTTINEISLKYQKDFGDKLPKIIVGKKLSELKEIDKISGASLTTAAFNQALQKLQQQL